MDDTAKNPLQSGLVDQVPINVIVGSVKGRVVHYGEEREDDVRQKKEIG